MEITTSADWPQVEQSLRNHIRAVGYNPDLHKMLRNIELMVTDLSRAEVEARRLKNTKYLQPQVAKINLAIENLERWAILLILSQ
jgi:hypothetical protein